MKRSPSISKPFAKSGKPPQQNPLGNVPIVQLVIMAIAITVMAAIFVQNLQPLVQIFFLGQKTLPIPLSVAMLAAFGIGGIIALIINAIASWRQDIAIRRAVVADRASDDDNEDVKSNAPQREQREVKTNTQNFYQDSQTPAQKTSQDNNLQEDLEDWEEEELEEDDLYEEDELEEDSELEDEVYEDEDPDTVPYGDLKKLKSAKPNRQKRDRPPLDARYIR